MITSSPSAVVTSSRSARVVVSVAAETKARVWASKIASPSEATMRLSPKLAGASSPGATCAAVIASFPAPPTMTLPPKPTVITSSPCAALSLSKPTVVMRPSPAPRLRSISAPSPAIRFEPSPSVSVSAAPPPTTMLSPSPPVTLSAPSVALLSPTARRLARLSVAVMVPSSASTTLSPSPSVMTSAPPPPMMKLSPMNSSTSSKIVMVSFPALASAKLVIAREARVISPLSPIIRFTPSASRVTPGREPISAVSAPPPRIAAVPLEARTTSSPSNASAFDVSLSTVKRPTLI